VVKTKRIAFTATNMDAEFLLIIPAGISLPLVLGLSESNLLSASLLNPIAAFRANTMHSKISKSTLILKSYSSSDTPRENPINAKGIAKIVCENLTRAKKFLTDLKTLFIDLELSGKFHNFHR
jgi:hypothetical protein